MEDEVLKISRKNNISIKFSYQISDSILQSVKSLELLSFSLGFFISFLFEFQINLVNEENIDTVLF